MKSTRIDVWDERRQELLLRFKEARVMAWPKNAAEPDGEWDALIEIDITTDEAASLPDYRHEVAAVRCLYRDAEWMGRIGRVFEIGGATRVTIHCGDHIDTLPAWMRVLPSGKIQ